MSELLRKGRLTSARRDVAEFTSSIKDDERLLKHVVNINKAHVIMLVEREIIDRIDGTKILTALAELDQGVKLRADLDDVHMAVEEEVIRAAGDDVGGNLNLAKSRNDQVATAIRMNLRDELLNLTESILALQDVLMQKSVKDLEAIIPGYTHLQPAQPITFAHYLIAQFDALERSSQRIREAYGRVDLCPMGAGALATTSFPISRERVADLLGFSEVLENSLDAVATRDFLLEVLAVLSVMAVDITRFVEDLIVWSSAEFGMIELPDEFAFTSSIMPQKKNPDVLEAIRARMSLILGDFLASATALKALPSAYNLDFQETTPRLWSAIEAAKGSVKMLAKIAPELIVKSSHLNLPGLSFVTSTELANMLVRKHKVPFRTAHKIVGAMTKALIEKGKSMKDATPSLLSEVSRKFVASPLSVKTEELKEAGDPSSFVRSHKVRGGPSREEVERMLNTRRESLALSGEWVSKKRRELVEAQKTLDSVMESYLHTAFSASPKHKV